ncbi:ArsR/SmtB family transcription factor [Jannaschia ovalis]|uniref:Winged helix-turn-helix domain-containing protein n=1 Tax=Jannaschia ovalis TaxID=3038773 RepID=A0ABY8LCL9_9RHOB|nr:winged helix-turn-helix domain-containing protein [Jannaschia sp. GRR-S6-38]WGH79072.1 winged helix-turn-helix domain-containing protein [Jannaschia sp. GRR-S6-38]
MRDGPDIAAIAALIGDPTRAAMLSALMDGRALTAGELATEAGVTPQTASSHIAKLEAGGMLARIKQGRHAYLRLAGPDVATILEGLMRFSARRAPPRTRPGPKDAALREARVCYNHLAGRRGVQLYRSLVAAGALSEGPVATARMAAALAPLGLDPGTVPGRSPLCRDCLDWSERRHHLAGRLGRAIFARMEEIGWLRRDAGSRAVLLTPPGRMAFDRAFPVPVRANG